MRGIPSARDGDGWSLVNPFLSMPLLGGETVRYCPSELDVRPGADSLISYSLVFRPQGDLTSPLR